MNDGKGKHGDGDTSHVKNIKPFAIKMSFLSLLRMGRHSCVYLCPCYVVSLRCEMSVR